MQAHWSKAVLVTFVFSCAAAAQKDPVIENAIGDFRGLAKKAKDANPILSTVEKGPAGLLESLGIGKSRSKGAGPIQVTLSKEQEEDLERRRKQHEKDELNARKPAPRPKPVVVAKVLPEKPVAPPPPAAPAPPPVTIVSGESLAAITPGMQREAVIASLGKPSAAASIAGQDDGTRETLYYHVDPQRRAMIKLLDGKVQAVVR